MDTETELLEYLENCPFETLTFLQDYHSGQWSLGYKLLSKTEHNITSACAEECRESEVYQELVEKYSLEV